MSNDDELIERTLQTLLQAAHPMFSDRFKRGDPGGMEKYLRSVVSNVSREWAQNPPAQMQRAIEKIMTLHAVYFCRMFDVQGFNMDLDPWSVAKGKIPGHLIKWDEGWTEFVKSSHFKSTWREITLRP